MHEGKVRAKILDSMMMANLPPVMLPPLTDYGMLTPTLGIKVSRHHPVWIGSVSFKFQRNYKLQITNLKEISVEFTEYGNFRRNANLSNVIAETYTY